MAFADKNIETLTRHEQYYIPTGDLCVLVQHVQFRIHRYFLERDSPYFLHELSKPATQSALSPSPAGAFPGSSDSTSIILENLTPDDFAQFLWVFYNPQYSIYVADVPAWSIILSLATRWQFAQVHQLCIRELERLSMTDVQRIKLYHANNVDREVLIPRYAALCERPEPLTVEEGLELGMETFAMIAAGRERVRWNTRLANGAMSPTSPPLTAKPEEVEDIVRGLFRITPPSALKSENSPGALANHKLTDTLKLTVPPIPPQKTAKPATVATPQPPKETNPTAKSTVQETKPNLTVKPTAPAPAKETKATGKAKGKQETKLQTPQKEKPQPWPVPASESNNSNKKGPRKPAAAAAAATKEGKEEETLAPAPTSAVPPSTTVPVPPPTDAVSTSDNTATTTTTTTDTTTTDSSSTSADSNSTAANSATTSDSTATTTTTTDPTTAEPTDSSSNATQTAPPTSTDLPDASKGIFDTLTSSGTFGVSGFSSSSLPIFSQQMGDTELDLLSLGGDNTDKNIEAKEVVDALVDSVKADVAAGAGASVDTSTTGSNKTEANEFSDLLF